MAATRRDSLSHFAKSLGGQLMSDGAILCPGPGHSRSDRSLSVRFFADGSFRVHSFAGDDWQACRDHVRYLCGLEPWTPERPRFSDDEEQRCYQERRNERIEEISRRQKQAALARRIWDEAADPRGTLVEAYLRNRGIFSLGLAAGHAIRFHPEVLFESVARPAMIARYTPIDETADLPFAIHRTALRPDGRGHLGKRMLGPVLGQVVRLTRDEPRDELVLGEGIETSLALATRWGRPTWAATTAGAIRFFPVLAGVARLVIGADHDFTGLEAANGCRDGWSDAGRGADVEIRWPGRIGSDFAEFADCDEGPP